MCRSICSGSTGSPSLPGVPSAFPSSVSGEDARLVPRWADRFLRALYREHAQGNAHIIELVDRLNNMDQVEFEKMRFEETSKGWQPKAA